MDNEGTSRSLSETVFLNISILSIGTDLNISLRKESTIMDLKSEFTQAFVSKFPEYYVPTFSRLLFSYKGHYLTDVEQTIDECGISDGSAITLHTGIPKKKSGGFCKSKCACCCCGGDDFDEDILPEESKLMNNNENYQYGAF
ncbi:uncharacterized protein MONOS_8692 [Monocercomonoides exilis]|uniref:uncharacterized protein n=1 Tax=Monocercomonoides exilis TaxID=2049356 RepID=UPI003559775A|nr:hypothetical protein MONOS_8692 [Monocercomonoides exilis]|eukprot:MONOS_8692.1-p1 / transcript=MONOS_8692.1 / gene=MONOS_8692 / organism=Monocercomonoides_exilis_PA203 / gene_product=unspecified product / transcript_product=unspecified product / location=Mono_scaffold00334:58874-59373(+) / protein_length=143 / sequence_SO=supercontig / SO=protein_coding / is_pseudo=false